MCKECGGSGLCEYRCQGCVGAGICEHGKRRRVYKECGGSGLCEHGKENRKCKDCRKDGVSMAMETMPIAAKTASKLL